jgi:hypothetical protein
LVDYYYFEKNIFPLKNFLSCKSTVKIEAQVSFLRTILSIFGTFIIYLRDNNISGFAFVQKKKKSLCLL